MKYQKMACVAANSETAYQAKKLLHSRYNFVAVDQADVIIALGGDGFVLHCLHKYLNLQKPIYGFNKGTVGFLMNAFDESDLPGRLEEASCEKLYPLSLEATTSDGKKHYAIAFNEVSLIRKSQQAANLEIIIDGKVRLEKLISDGVLIATPAGSTAYNLSVHGPIIPIGSSILALTPISPFRPRRWRGALLPHHVCIEIVNMDPKKRPISATADSNEINDVVSVCITEKKETYVQLMFDQNHSLDERIILEQFA